jgi:hypothetical protein
MTIQEYRKIEQILQGIDRSETDLMGGWWETSTGANFGKEKLRQIKLLVDDCEKQQSCEWHMCSEKATVAAVSDGRLFQVCVTHRRAINRQNKANNNYDG